MSVLVISGGVGEPLFSPRPGVVTLLHEVVLRAAVPPVSFVVIRKVKLPYNKDKEAVHG